jgi:hypothetical protein
MPDRNRNRPRARPEFELAYSTRELGPALQRELLPNQLLGDGGSGSARSSHGEDIGPEPLSPPPSEDRAG